MPKRMKRTKKASEATKNKVYNSYYNFIDFMELDEYSSNFTLDDVVKWMAIDSGATKGSDKYKVVAYVAVAMAKTWRNLGLTKKIDDNEYEAIDFNYDLGDGDSYDESEWKGVKDVDDSYFRDYGMRDMSFPKIDDSYDNYEESRRIRGRKMLREGKDFKNLKVDLNNPMSMDVVFDKWNKIVGKNNEFSIDEFVDYICDINNLYMKEIENILISIGKVYPFYNKKFIDYISDSLTYGKVYSPSCEDIERICKKLLENRVKEGELTKSDKKHYQFKY